MMEYNVQVIHKETGISVIFNARHGQHGVTCIIVMAWGVIFNHAGEKFGVIGVRLSWWAQVDPLVRAEELEERKKSSCHGEGHEVVRRSALPVCIRLHWWQLHSIVFCSTCNKVHLPSASSVSLWTGGLRGNLLLCSSIPVESSINNCSSKSNIARKLAILWWHWNLRVKQRSLPFDL
jgi:hypothetical protein